MIRIRERIKTMIYLSVINNAELATYLDEQFGTTVEEHFYEAGAELNSEEIIYPAIRYRLISDPDTDSECEDCNTIPAIFEMYVEAREQLTQHSDNIIDILRSHFKAGGGRALGLFTESSTFQNALIDSGVESGDAFVLSTWACDVLNATQLTTPDASLEDVKVTQLSGKDRMTLNIIRFQIDIGNDRIL